MHLAASVRLGSDRSFAAITTHVRFYVGRRLELANIVSGALKFTD